MILPVHSQIGVQELLHPRRQVGHDVRAVGNMADGDIGIVEPFPHITPYMPGELTVYQAYGIPPVGHLEGQDIHKERLVFTAFLLSQFPEL